MAAAVRAAEISFGSPLNARPCYEGLTGTESAFVDHFFRSGSQIQTARAAGYANPESNAFTVFHCPDVQAVLRRLHEENTLSGAEILSRLSAQARGSRGTGGRRAGTFPVPSGAVRKSLWLGKRMGANQLPPRVQKRKPRPIRNPASSV